MHNIGQPETIWDNIGQLGTAWGNNMTTWENWRQPGTKWEIKVQPYIPGDRNSEIVFFIISNKYLAGAVVQ